MSEDFVQRDLSPATAESLAFFDIAERMSNLGRDIKEFMDVSYEPVELSDDHFVDYDEHRRIGEEKYQQLNVEQKLAVDDIIKSVHSQQGHCFFIDGPGGSGKTFVYNTIYHRLRAEKKNVQCVAWTGIAANLLPDGRTVNSTFKLIVANDNKTSSMKPQGQSFNRVGLWLDDPIFSHGQLYVALSRARHREGVKIKSEDNHMRNIVYHEIL